ncbi:MAG: RDD family protein [Pseudolysinimonas sp.]|uniref:RDD family protein n=1 Tax=Pseudolysinimonas sp. TaxID=2680009 RepID=UPI003264E738
MAVDPDSEWIDDYAPGEDGVLTGEAVALDLHPTGFVLRAAGALIDILVYVAFLILVLTVVGFVAAYLGTEPAVVQALFTAIPVIGLVAIPMTIETLTKGKSIGKLVIGGRIVRNDGGSIGLRHAAIRALASYVDFYVTLGGGAAVTGLLTPRTQRIGDLLAGTYCQYERVSGRVLPLFGIPPQLAGWATIVDVARMPTQLSRRIGQFLAQATTYDGARRAYLSNELAREAAEYVHPVPAVEPELFLAGITVVRREREAEALRIERERLVRLQPALRGTPHDFPVR